MTESLSFLIGLTDLITFILSPEPFPRRGLTTGNYIAKEENSHSAFFLSEPCQGLLQFWMRIQLLLPMLETSRDS